VSKVPVENAFRAQHMKIVARWNKPGFTVIFRGMTDSRKRGEITMSTKQATEGEPRRRRVASQTLPFQGCNGDP
jgi:hypothetical protein